MRMNTTKPYMKLAAHGITLILAFFALFIISRHSYLLFHGLAEMFSVAIAISIFMVAWNTRKYLNNDYLLFVGIALLYVAFLDLLHTLSYKGMLLFQEFGANLPTQLWIAARYLYSAAFLAAPFFLKHRLKPSWAFFTFSALLLFILLSLFQWSIFPVCFVEGTGLTSFKIISEYLISTLLTGVIFFLFKYRRFFQ